MERPMVTKKTAKRVAERGLRFVRIGVTRNMKNYESLRVDIEIEVQTGESLRDATTRCTRMVVETIEDIEGAKKMAKLRKLAKREGLIDDGESMGSFLAGRIDDEDDLAPFG
jgi:hypothetical protein